MNEYTGLHKVCKTINECPQKNEWVYMFIAGKYISVYIY